MILKNLEQEQGLVIYSIFHRSKGNPFKAWSGVVEYHLDDGKTHKQQYEQCHVNEANG